MFPYNESARAYPRGLSVHQLENACASGASGSAPSAFRVFFDMDERGYTYRNDWWSDVIPITSGPTPSSPTNVQAVRTSSKNVRVSWTAVSGATGYYIKARGLIYNSEVGGDLPYYTTKIVNTTATSADVGGGRIDRIAVFAKGKDDRVVSQLTRTPLVGVSG